MNTNMSNQLYNKRSQKDLKKALEGESFDRLTLSFYKYVNLEKVDEWRDRLYVDLNSMNVLGRIYVSTEGINAQVSIPKNLKSNFINYFNSYKQFKNIQVKRAVQEGNSFYKLTIKIKDEIVAYDIDDNQYDMSVVGEHLDPMDFNEAIENKNSIVVDIRNHYESEVGRFKDAIVPDVDRSQELLEEVKNLLNGKENKKILLYCTGGIRCEKASSYLIKHKFKNVFQLKGGIIQYAHQIKEQKIKSKFKGKNFVFDDRLGERITEDILSNCHQCEKACDNHINCENDACHLLFIQCDKCKKKYDGCCSKGCAQIIKLPIQKQRILRKEKPDIAAPLIHHYRDRLRPKLKEMKSRKNITNQ